MRSTILTAAALAVLGLSGAAAQDALTAGPGIYRKVTENDRVRVLEGQFKPGAKMGMHRHPDHLFYMLTDGTLILKPEGKKPYEMMLSAGDALFLPAQTRASENETDRTIRVLVVEFKTAAASPGRSGKRAGKAKGKTKTKAKAKPKKGRAAPGKPPGRTG